MQTTRRDLFKSAAPAVMAGALGFPAVGRAEGYADTGSASGTADRTGSAVASNGYLSSLLPLEDQRALREINVSLTRLAIRQCVADGVANQIVFDTRICEALAAFEAHDVPREELLRLSRDCDVVFLWSLAYGGVRTTFNARFIRFPLAVAFPRTVDEVVFWVNFVRDHQFSVSIRSGNNCYESFSIDNEIVIDLTFLTLRSAGFGESGEQFWLDRAAGVVHVAPGMRLGVLYTELAERGVTFAGGQCSPVCIGGLVGTGGVGYATRAFGYACDQLVEVEYVLADGSVVTANAVNRHTDLFRATKGAGAAGLGVMTRLTVRVVPAATILFYAVTFALKDAAIVLAQWQNLAASAPDALSSVANLTANVRSSLPTGAFFIDGEFHVEGDVQAARQQLKNVLCSQWLDRLPPPLNKTPIEIQELTSVEAATALALQVPQPTFNQWKLKSNFVFHRLSAAALQPLVNFLLTHAPGDDPSRAIGAVNILLMGGKANQINPSSAVVPARQGTVMWVHGGALWNEQPLEAQSLEFVDTLSAILKPILQSQTAQYGVPDLDLGSQLTTPPDLNYLKAYWSSPTANYVPFLTAVKQRYDPQDVFRFAQSIPVKSPI
ncbi:MAG: FAD-binding oxidoreductase [Stellaceae bacterium]